MVSFLAEKLKASQECFYWLEAVGYGKLLCYHTCLFCRLSQDHCFKIIYGVVFNKDIFLFECLYVNNRMFPLQ